MRRQRRDRNGLRARFRLGRDAEPQVGLPEAEAVEKRRIGDTLGEPHVIRGGAPRSPEIPFEPEEPRAAAHRAPHALFLGGEQLAGPPRGDECRVQGGLGVRRAPDDLLVQPVDFAGGG